MRVGWECVVFQKVLEKSFSPDFDKKTERIFQLTDKQQITCKFELDLGDPEPFFTFISCLSGRNQIRVG